MFTERGIGNNANASITDRENVKKYYYRKNRTLRTFVTRGDGIIPIGCSLKGKITSYSPQWMKNIKEEARMRYEDPVRSAQDREQRTITAAHLLGEDGT